MGLDCNNMATPDLEDDAAGCGVITSGNGTFKPRGITEAGHDRTPSHASETNHSALDWSTNYVDQGKTIAPRRRHKNNDRYRPVGGPADFSYRLT